jgi:hypothetical protein
MMAGPSNGTVSGTEPGQTQLAGQLEEGENRSHASAQDVTPESDAASEAAASAEGNGEGVPEPDPGDGPEENPSRELPDDPTELSLEELMAIMVAPRTPPAIEGMTEEDLPPVLTLADGTVVAADELILILRALADAMAAQPTAGPTADPAASEADPGNSPAVSSAFVPFGEDANSADNASGGNHDPGPGATARDDDLRHDAPHSSGLGQGRGNADGSAGQPADLPELPADLTELGLEELMALAVPAQGPPGFEPPGQTAGLPPGNGQTAAQGGAQAHGPNKGQGNGQGNGKGNAGQVDLSEPPAGLTELSLEELMALVVSPAAALLAVSERGPGPIATRSQPPLSNSGKSDSHGNDLLTGDGGNDTLQFAGDSITPQDPGDSIAFGVADGTATVTVTMTDVLEGGPGDDTLNGGSGSDEIFGYGGDDVLKGQEGDDALHGGDGADTLKGQDGNDALFGDAQADDLIGGDGADTLDGGAGDDTLTGGAGDDVLDGGAGSDVLNSGSGNDTLVWDASDTSIDGQGGTDTLRVDSGDVDLTSFAGTIQGIEKINLGSDAGSNAATLTAQDVLDMSDTDALTILGDAGDSIDAGTGWSDGGFDGNGNHLFIQDVGGTLATLILSPDITTNPDIAV